MSKITRRGYVPTDEKEFKIKTYISYIKHQMIYCIY